MSIKFNNEVNKRFETLETVVKALELRVQELREQAEREQQRVQEVVKRGPGRPPKVQQ